jgi:ankyrin repeat protein
MVYYISDLLLLLRQHGNTPLHMASQRGITETAEMLIKRGANIYIKNKVSAISYCNPRRCILHIYYFIFHYDDYFIFHYARKDTLRFIRLLGKAKLKLQRYC